MDLVTSILIPAVSSFGTAFLTKGDGGVAETFRAIWYNHIGFRFIERQKDIQNQREDARQNHPDLLPQIEAMQSELDIIKIDQQKFLEQLAPLISNIDEENLISPRRDIAIPTLNALEAFGADEDIRNMFANLLASSMDKSKFASVRPTFVQIIKEMSPIDARLLSKLSITGPIAKIIEINDSRTQLQTLQSNLLDLSFDDYTVLDIAASVDNLIRLGVIQIVDGRYKPDFNYEIFKDTDAFKTMQAARLSQIEALKFSLENQPDISRSISEDWKKSLSRHQNSHVEIEKSEYITTEFGKQFKNICID